jgi:hypothetical protein
MDDDEGNGNVVTARSRVSAREEERGGNDGR